MAQHRDVAYWFEAAGVWMRGNALHPSDQLAACHARPAVAATIRKRFEAFLERSGRPRLAEKTPANALRLPFIHSIFPDARVIHIIRNGRDVVRSLCAMQVQPTMGHALKKRLWETAFWEWPAYAPAFFRTTWRTRVRRRPATFIGPKPDGWRAWVGLPRHVIAGLQWEAVVREARRAGQALGTAHYHEIRYEMLMTEPGRVIRDLLRFTGLAPAEAVQRYAREAIDPHRPRRWDDLLSSDTEADIARRVQGLNCELGYG